MAKTIRITGRFAVGASLPFIRTGPRGWGVASMAERQLAAYVEAVGREPNNFAADSLGARQFAYRTKANRQQREDTVFALAGVRIDRSTE